MPLCECFDIDKNEWYTTASMNLTHSALAVGVCKGLVNTREFIYQKKDRKLCNGGLQQSSGDIGQQYPWYHKLLNNIFSIHLIIELINV